MRSGSVLITGVAQGGLIDVWNEEEGRLMPPYFTVEPGDRVVQVGGKTGSARELHSRLKSPGAAGLLELMVSRPGLESSSAGPVVEVASLTRRARDDAGLWPQPEREQFRTAIVEVYVERHPFGGADKTSSGHRHDTIPLANSLIAEGLSCQLVQYNCWEHDRFLEVCSRFDALILRCAPGHVVADHGDQTRFDEGLRGLQKRGIEVWPSPNVVEVTSNADILAKIANLNIGLEDTFVYHSPEAFSANFRKTVAFRPRVMKPCEGYEDGAGIWIVKLRDENYCRYLGQRVCKDSEILCLMEAVDNHYEEHTVGEFAEFCTYGRTRRAGAWTSRDPGAYLDGHKGLLDQRFCPKAAEALVRCWMVGAELAFIARRQSTDATFTHFAPDDPRFRFVTEDLLLDLPQLMASVGMSGEELPLMWAVDFVSAYPDLRPGSPQDVKWTALELNCSCPAIPHCYPACCSKENPHACMDDVPPEDRAAVREICGIVSKGALARLHKVTKRSPDGHWRAASAADNDLRPFQMRGQ
jgi:hypothetical protein